MIAEIPSLAGRGGKEQAAGISLAACSLVHRSNRLRQLITAITTITNAAFSGLAISDPTEQFVIKGQSVIN